MSQLYRLGLLFVLLSVCNLSFGSTTVLFEENKGQFYTADDKSANPDSVLFVLKTPDIQVVLTPDGLNYSLYRLERNDITEFQHVAAEDPKNKLLPTAAEQVTKELIEEKLEMYTIRMVLEGASILKEKIEVEDIPAELNVFRGDEQYLNLSLIHI